MSKYIELIDKYRMEQSALDTDYNPPNYIWNDNTGELVRCKDCKNWGNGDITLECPWDLEADYGEPKEYDYCSKGERKQDE